MSDREVEAAMQRLRDEGNLIGVSGAGHIRRLIEWAEAVTAALDAVRSPQGEDHEAAVSRVRAVLGNTHDEETDTEIAERIVTALSRCPSPERDTDGMGHVWTEESDLERLDALERDTERLVEARRHIERLLATSDPMPPDGVDVAVEALRFLAEFSADDTENG